MTSKRDLRAVPATLMLVVTMLLLNIPAKRVNAASVCQTSTLTTSTSSYDYTVCLTEPASGSTLSGVATVSATVTSTSGAPRVQRVQFYLNGAYLLTDYQSPYTFLLPTTQWVDNKYSIGVNILTSSGFVSTTATVNLNFKNGITKTPVNNNHFTPTGGRVGMPFVVMATGDGASGEKNETNVTDLVANVNPNLFLYLGDVYEKGTYTEFYNWYGHNGSLYNRFRPITNPVIGNHEYEDGVAPGYFYYWDNIPNYYSFNAGGWHFINLNSNTNITPLTPSSAQYAWLKNDLAAYKDVCIVVSYHHPLFDIGAEGPKPELTDAWALMYQYKVTMVLNGHDHNYQRWKPLDGSGSLAANGITEFVLGAGGHGIQTITDTDDRVAKWTSSNPGAFGALKLTLGATSADFAYLSYDGTVLDSGTIQCNQSGRDIQAPTTPTGLTATAFNDHQVNLNWQASADAFGVAGYTIYRNGGKVATTSATSYADTELRPARTYTYTVDAFDKGGNHSAKSDSASVATPAQMIYIPLILNQE